MASNDPTKDTLPTVQVKIEPGTSTSSEPFTSSESLPYIKSEPSSQPVPSQRLTSFRLPRDLTLGGNIKIEKPKKVYAPNVNVQRNKKKIEPLELKIKHEVIEQTNYKRQQGRGGSRGRGRGKDYKSNLIQTTGVWSEGIYMPPKESKRHNSDRDTIKVMAKPKIDLDKLSDDPEKEDRYMLLKQYLKGEILDDEQQRATLEQSGKVMPATLPRAKNKSRWEDVDPNDKSKRKPTRKPVKNNRTISEIIDENNPTSYILIQLPDRLPALASKEETEEAGPSAGPSNAGPSKGKNDATATIKCLPLNGLREGRIGTLEILKSGKTRLVLGKTPFHVNPGIPTYYRKDLMAVKVDKDSTTGEAVHLGTIDDKLIFAPDLSTILGKDIKDLKLK